MIITFLIFLVLIQFELSTFWQVFNHTRELAEKYNNLQNAVTNAWKFHVFGRAMLAQLLGPPAVLGAVFLVAWLNRSKFEIKIDGYLLGVFALLQLVVFLPAFFSNGTARTPMFCTTLIALFFVSRLKVGLRLFGRLAWTGLVIVFLFFTGHQSSQLLGLLMQPATSPSQSLLAQLEEMHPAYIYADQFAIREVLDYRLPFNCLDYHFAKPATWLLFPGPSDFPKGGVLLISKEEAFQLHLHDYPLAKMPLIPLVGKAFPVATDNPYECVLIPTTGQ